ncbi:Proclavaminate amidinohydrolase [Raoultella planticola]|uniref:Proclavaminate amidinohydrolase n=1 Tax=Raoultella planticola TaxID=575 RepID=A0A485C0A3_RAOPL|nr:Proclavaminate amidinohydrolase [Raoultella planticola]
MTSATEHEFPQPQDGEIPRFSGLPTFFRLPFAPQTSELDISVVGVPWDGGTTNPCRHAPRPRELRNASSLVRRIHPVTAALPTIMRGWAIWAMCGLIPWICRIAWRALRPGITPLISSR